ncbi:PQQ-binding-like beta-propeller repeat protein [Bythopirellula goksoeyrii]|uniref:Outer membrane biogenesis protein BamB n=1 Tax=Bythopirellula goksoeyrii TaxID=1400387 RepID=A0A5B9QLN3_9BACT|nr:PQQ-binding-like beta-propeller repeat protein [Bythopirellula goksoeyrii]QEG35051.1 outer membrane biogenesis protein BamB [Bythopirellula goksoeyrii]
MQDRYAARLSALGLSIILLAISVPHTIASDWSRFRGPNGSGVSPDTETMPATWTDTENVKWSIDLPGPGSSCPIVVGDKVFVTCWSGYGLDRNEPGDQEDLKRHLVCVNRENGKVLWDKSIDPYLPEDEYGGMFAEHGYASHTPVSDGEKVYAFFGKTGVVAFDMDGNKLWQTSVGMESGIQNWGTASSPLLYKNLVIVPAAAENHALVALDKETGSEVWKQEAEGFAGTWGSPILVDGPDGDKQVVLAVPGEIWAFNSDSGKLKWYSKGPGDNSYTSSVVTSDGNIFALGNRDGDTIAVKVGGKGDVSESNILWTSRERGGIGSPLVHDGLIYWISRDIATCIDAATGEEVYQERLETPPADETAAEEAGGRRGRFSNSSYSSVVAADGKLYFITRQGLCYVLKLGPEFEQLAVNRFGNDEGDFSATPAISDGELFIRSSEKLYCVAEKK